MQHAAADRHHPFTVASRIHPAHDAGEQAAVIGLDAPDQCMRGITRCAADRGGGVDAAGQLQRIGLRILQLTTNAGGKMPQGRRVYEGGPGGHVQRGTQGFQPGPDVCSYELVLVMVLARGCEPLGRGLVFDGVGLATGGARQRVGLDRGAVLLDQQLGADAYQVDVAGQRYLKQITRRIEPAQIVAQRRHRHRPGEVKAAGDGEHHLVDAFGGKCSDGVGYPLLKAVLIRHRIHGTQGGHGHGLRMGGWVGIAPHRGFRHVQPAGLVHVEGNGPDNDRVFHPCLPGTVEGGTDLLLQRAVGCLAMDGRYRDGLAHAVGMQLAASAGKDELGTGRHGLRARRRGSHGVRGDLIVGIVFYSKVMI